MADRFRITLGQLNPTVGDLAGNAALAREAWQAGKEAGADLVALPEMFITGYNAQDLVMKRAFQLDVMTHIEALAADCADGPALAIGAPWAEGTALYNAYLILKGGKIASRSLKYNLPNETVFDEVRIFDAGPLGGPYSVGNTRIGSPICEDAWHPDVAETLEETGAEFLLVPNGSPYYRNKMETRMNVMVARVIETGLPLIYLNMIGGQDDQVFDGASFALNPGGKLAMQLPAFERQITHVDLERTPEGWRVVQQDLAHLPDAWEQDYRVMVLGLRDYMRKTGFKKVLLGLSGGIDSAIVATIAVDALGADNVRCVMLPSEYTSQASLDDAEAVAKALGCRYDYVPISEGRAAITNTLAPLFEGYEPGLTEENIQSRLRGLLLMAMSNKFGEMLLTTGNKSEVAVGYATIYGDMSGGYNPIKDMYKTRVFETCRWRNANYRDWMMGPEGEMIPDRIITKPPTAELREDQKDSDSLPDYPVLDAILNILVDQDGSIEDCVAAGFDRDIAKKVEHLIYISEYKRFQSAPGPRLTKGAFWLDRRYPIVNRWRDPS
ncbi:NAD+ synthase [Sulfitobacter mediterraneus]|uniref:NAD+ synthase n=1 Tax=Sulfitobacter mediterraneus TaxID=83219 RepID=UPI00193452FC|nr:NAD+ synthase [Sulfitobacter mediterraneus]MBM1634255.1 NAD+ synthase [Sulfitobacter mediterraneus]MBM1642072.1 NAD+ synthase [Sulfitobacter mediterraneus]MBM1646121.1 NAD+ synthase [Sulfitobacter mediterraneus]MBM1650167.1 NAD+ synthase [Sulfitobacter mediterraneus]MBM1654189.1 NAD+ synthase [Sulfitobacter mediterraneus]